METSNELDDADKHRKQRTSPQPNLNRCVGDRMKDKVVRAQLNVRWNRR